MENVPPTVKSEKEVNVTLQISGSSVTISDTSKLMLILPPPNKLKMIDFGFTQPLKSYFSVALCECGVPYSMQDKVMLENNFHPCLPELLIFNYLMFYPP